MNSIIGTLLWRWTALLALAWVAHSLLRKTDCRWRVRLWRGMLCCVCVLPLLSSLPLPALRIPIWRQNVPPIVNETIHAKTGPLSLPSENKAASPGAVLLATSVSASTRKPGNSVIARRISAENLFLLLWAGGFLGLGWRLVRAQAELNRLKRRAVPADAKWQEPARMIAEKLGVSRRMRVGISEAITSPCACGILRPAILLPRSLAREAEPEEVALLLAHEAAHFRGHDLFWRLGWRWMQAALWFHPLAWGISSAHNFASELEADRVASEQLKNRQTYCPILARLALRVLNAPTVGGDFAFSATSQIGKRIEYFKRAPESRWTWKRAAIAAALPCALLLAVVGCKLSNRALAPSDFKKVEVIVTDKDGHPISQATIKVTGFRVNGLHGADAYGWNKTLFGAAPVVTTDQDGKARINYPIVGIPQEKESTRSLILWISHSNYCTLGVQDYPVDGKPAPIQLTAGIPLEVSGYYGPDRQPVTDLIPNLAQNDISAEDMTWQNMDHGVFAFGRLSPGGHLLQLMGRLPSGEIVYSDTLAFTAYPGHPCQFTLEMKPGIRLEGRLDDKVPRPVKNGRVMIDVRPKEYPATHVIEDFYDLDGQNGGRHFWHSYRPINSDGTFVFESIPPGELDAVVIGDGFVSKTVGELQNRVDGELKSDKTRPGTIPEAFPLTEPVTKIEIATEATTTLDLTATTTSGKPIEGAQVWIYESAFRMWGNFGWMAKSSEEPYRKIPALPDLNFNGKTDASGRMILPNLPPKIWTFDVAHANYQLTIQEPHGWHDRHIRTAFAPGQTNVMRITMEPNGTDYLGSLK